MTEYWVMDNDRASKRFHRTDGPAVLYPEEEEWYIEGKLHRDGDELASLDEHPLIKEMLERMGELEEGSEEQRKFNKALMDTLGQLRPLIDAVNDQAQDPDLN